MLASSAAFRLPSDLQIDQRTGVVVAGLGHAGDFAHQFHIAFRSLVSGACVQAEVIDQIKADKVITYVKRRRKHSSQRTRGHRQQLTLLRITEILENGAAKSGVKEAIGAGIAGWTGTKTDKGDYVAAA